MDFVKKVIQESVTLESLFDEYGAVPDKSAFKDLVVADARATGKSMKIDTSGSSGDDVVIKVLDPHTSMMYNVFKDNNEYKDWMRQSLHEPTEDEVLQSLRENG